MKDCIECGKAGDGARCTFCGTTRYVLGYTTLRVVAKTAHSKVYFARDRHQRNVALKELVFIDVPAAEQLDAFRREAQVLRSLSHPRIPHFIEEFEDGEGVALRLYLASEFIDGESLATRIERAPLDAEQLKAVADSVLEVLTYLHSRAPVVLHRDIKPANIVFRSDGSLALVDFGSARNTDASRTHRSTLVGTFGYMPPEQLGGTASKSGDVYSLGATLLHAATQKPPSEWLDSDLRVRVPESVGPAWRGWLEKALARDVAARFQSAEEARAALARPLRRATGFSWARVFGLTAAIAVPLWGVMYAMRPAASEAVRSGSTTAALFGDPPLAPTVREEERWFKAVRPRCNTVEVRRAMAETPPPETTLGVGYGAGCFALGGKLEDARKLIYRLQPNERYTAAGVVFDLGHPVADQGDDVSAAPIMKLVVEFWPNHFMALYHLGVSEYVLGQPNDAAAHLEQFLKLYLNEDGFRANARRIIERVKNGLQAEPGESGAH